MVCFDVLELDPNTTTPPTRAAMIKPDWPEEIVGRPCSKVYIGAGRNHVERLEADIDQLADGLDPIGHNRSLKRQRRACEQAPHR